MTTTTTHLIRSTVNNIEADVKTYLESVSITTWRGMTVFTYGQELWCFIIFE